MSKSSTVYNSYFQHIERPEASFSYDVTSVVSCTNFLNGIQMPDYKQKIRDKISAVTDMNAQSQTAVFTRGKTTGIYDLKSFGGFSDTYMGYGPNKPSFDTIDPRLISSAQATARAHAASKLRSLQTPFEALSFMGEFKDTVKLLRNPLKGAVDLTHSLLDKRKHKLLPGDIGNLWLEYRFGILPLLSDIKDILNILDNKKERFQHETFKSYGKDESASIRYVTLSSPGIVGDYIHKQVYTYRAECFIRCGYDISLLDNGLSYSSIAIDTVNDLSSIPITAWELMPFSFLVDYFVNVGDIIQSSTISRGALTYTSESTVLTSVFEDQCASFNFTSFPGTLTSLTPSKFTFTERKVSRVGGQLAIPPLVLSLPGSNIKLLNIAALLAQLL